jgi:hypothetical protein
MAESRAVDGASEAGWFTELLPGMRDKQMTFLCSPAAAP